jgi:hypothetical protein
VAIITGGFSLLGNVISNLAVHNKTLYRLEQLEKKQDKHNHVIERMYNVETVVEVLSERQKVTNHRIDDLEEFVKERRKVDG